MNIHDIIYEKTRDISNIETKIKIATIIIFCLEHSAEYIAELLYTKNYESLLTRIRNENHDIDVYLNLDDRNTREAFVATVEAVRSKSDEDGFYCAVYEKDEFALAIIGILNATEMFKAELKNKQFELELMEATND